MNQHLRQVHGKEKSNNADELTAPSLELNSEVKVDSDEQSPENSLLEFQYACNDCGRRFRLKCTLTAHRTIHSNDRPFECWMCRRS